MKNYDGILILEPEDTFSSIGTYGEPRLSIRGGERPLYGATTVIAKTYSGELQCLKSRERSQIGYSQSELQEIVDHCENHIEINLLLML
jgi:hypothetical protein